MLMERSLIKTITLKKVGVNSIIVPMGMDYKIVLDDGSEVWLNFFNKARLSVKI